MRQVTPIFLTLLLTFGLTSISHATDPVDEPYYCEFDPFSCDIAAGGYTTAPISNGSTPTSNGGGVTWDPSGGSSPSGYNPPMGGNGSSGNGSTGSGIYTGPATGGDPSQPHPYTNGSQYNSNCDGPPSICGHP